MKKILVYSILLHSAFAFAQSSQMKKADKLYHSASFEKAAETYSEILEVENNTLALKKAADSYYFISNFEKAAPLYKKLVENRKESLDELYFFRYAQTLNALGKYEDAQKWMKIYEKEVSEVEYKANRDKLENIKNQGNKFEIKNLELNTSTSEFAPYVYNHELYYSTPKKGNFLDKKYNWTGEKYLDIYTVGLKENEIDSIAKPFSDAINSKLHESNIAITKDGKTLYFTRNNSENGRKRKRDNEKVTHLGIYKADWVNNQWTNIEPLSINNANYSVMHPALNSDNSKIYFASDMPGTNGSFDLFYVTLSPNGKLGTPVNLGPEINTKNREQFPFLNEDDDLFFASDGHRGFGLLDVFMAKKSNDGYSTPLNVGLPINTNRDDFSFILNSNTQKGFFASNRLDGKGDDDLYAVTQIAPLDNFQYYVEGRILDNDGNPINEKITISIYDENNNKISEKELENQNVLRFDLPPGTYKLKASNPNYIPAEKTFTILDNGNSKNEQDLVVQRIPNTFLEDLIAEEGDPKVITDNGVLMFDLPEILFNFDKFDIREDARVHLDQLIDKLKRYPKVNIEIGSHTDIRGTKEYNETLSHNRANATRDYIIKRGIAEDRITAFGYGESKPKVDCLEHNCTEAEHQINRRSEFVIVVDKKDLK